MLLCLSSEAGNLHLVLLMSFRYVDALSFYFLEMPTTLVFDCIEFQRNHFPCYNFGFVSMEIVSWKIYATKHQKRWNAFRVEQFETKHKQSFALLPSGQYCTNMEKQVLAQRRKYQNLCFSLLGDGRGFLGFD